MNHSVTGALIFEHLLGNRPKKIDRWRFIPPTMTEK
jgi:hypothetical protein